MAYGGVGQCGGARSDASLRAAGTVTSASEPLAGRGAQLGVPQARADLSRPPPSPPGHWHLQGALLFNTSIRLMPAGYNQHPAHSGGQSPGFAWSCCRDFKPGQARRRRRGFGRPGAREFEAFEPASESSYQ